MHIYRENVNIYPDKLLSSTNEIYTVRYSNKNKHLRSSFLNMYTGRNFALTTCLNQIAIIKLVKLYKWFMWYMFSFYF